ncbi:MAG: glycosyltransferase family 39 protein [Armatimonadetes bacterium]|nr:glycosyltransferase family 39 protein [Armatimonadota bacterium]
MQAENEKPSKLIWIALAAILILAAALRFYGLRWGLPNDLHAYSYHPDEFLTVGSSARIAGLVDGHRTLNPGLYNYPSLYLYLSALSMMVGNGYGLLGGSQSTYLAARIVTALMGVGAVGATYWAGRVMFGTTAGILAAFILAIAPIHVQHSHFATVDVPSTLFIALCLGFSALILKRGSWRDYILAGVMAGLAGGTKYNAVLVIFAPMAAHFLATSQSSILQTAQHSILSSVEGCGRRSTLSRLKAALGIKLWLIPACAIAAFIISTPGSLLYTSQFLHGITYEMLHASKGHGLVFAGTGNGFLYTFVPLSYGLGFMLAMVFTAAAIWGLWKRDRRILMLLAFVAPYYILISVSQVRFARYAMPMILAAALMIGWLVQRCYEGLRERKQPFTRLVFVAVSAFVVGGTLSYALFLTAQFGRPDPRDEAARWIMANAQKNSGLGFLDVPWFYSPPLLKNLGFGILQQRQEAVTKIPFQVTIFSEKSEPGWWWRESRPQWVIATDYETQDAIRLRDNTSISSADRQAVVSTLADLKLLKDHYRVRKVFTNTMGSHLPHDMRYVSPTITIYELK